MDSRSFKTVFVPKHKAEHDWVIIDAQGLVLGRLASRIAYHLRGKHKASFTPNSDCGDRVIVINAEKVRLTGNKMNDRPLVWYTGYPGGQRFRTPREALERTPEKLIEHAVKGMLPRNRLGRRLFTNLHVYAGPAHPHEAQNPKPISFTL